MPSFGCDEGRWLVDRLQQGHGGPLEVLPCRLWSLRATLRSLLSFCPHHDAAVQGPLQARSANKRWSASRPSRSAEQAERSGLV
jgi:hypothetical protein